MQIAIVLHPGVTALDAIGPDEVPHTIPDAEVHFVDYAPGPVVTDSGVLVVGATHSFEETPSPDLLLVPGSFTDTTTAMADDRLLAWLRAVNSSTRATASLRSGSLVPGAAG